MADSFSSEPDSKRTLWRAIRRFFDGTEGDTSLRAQLEEAIDEHEDGHQSGKGGDGDLTPLEREMVRNLLHFSELDADDVAIPRGEIIAIPASATWDEVVAAFAEHGHSRLPVYGETLDEVVGMMLIKDVFPLLAASKPPRDWTSLMRQPLFVPSARGALDVLNDMRASRVHLAVVIDEYSGTDGIITFEDLVEEIVGEIEDEHDDAPRDLFKDLGNGMWEVDARAELDDIGDRVDPRLGDVEEDVDTIGGLAFLLAGQVPQKGAILGHDSGWKLEVVAGNEKHVTRLRLHPPLPAVEDPEE
ncbi:CBS domain protein [Novosphingobium kunmingense]|uniref:CBS domain protein n=1 Tax=Novosphingobium kunmingense TaxID=1211806 RepID=A0A2N0I442_9SPHN|nr:hemolysin family protein [Novosphingobium kunmingense]PKB25925.1 CBS domain protein [Novosphingobium kunmingense]